MLSVKQCFITSLLLNYTPLLFQSEELNNVPFIYSFITGRRLPIQTDHSSVTDHPAKQTHICGKILDKHQNCPKTYKKCAHLDCIILVHVFIDNQIFGSCCEIQTELMSCRIFIEVMMMSSENWGFAAGSTAKAAFLRWSQIKVGTVFILIPRCISFSRMYLSNKSNHKERLLMLFSASEYS